MRGSLVPEERGGSHLGGWSEAGLDTDTDVDERLRESSLNIRWRTEDGASWSWYSDWSLTAGSELRSSLLGGV